jgi:hypothetical protein
MSRPRATPSVEYGTETLSPDSISVDEPERRDCCSAHPWDDCEPDCDCPDCADERALDDDATAYQDREW